MKKRVETVVTIDTTWRDKGEIDIILPEDVTDYMVYDYDSSEILFIVRQGKLFEYDINDGKFVEAGEMKPSILEKTMKYAH